MMKSVTNLYLFLARFMVFALLAGLFPITANAALTAVSNSEAIFQAPVTMEVIAVSNPEVSLTVPSCLAPTSDFGLRLDYVLNSNCGDVVIGSLPAWPKLSVTQALIPAPIVATTLPAAPTVRFVQINRLPISLVDAIVSLALAILIWLIVKLGKLRTAPRRLGLIRLSKTLSELQVQRC